MKMPKFVLFVGGMMTGGWLTWLLADYMLKQSFIGLEAAGNANWINIRFEMIENMGKLAIFLFLPTLAITILAAVTFFRNTTRGVK